MLADEMRKVTEQNADRQKALDYCKKWILYEMDKASKRGMNHTCFTPTSHMVNGKLYDLKDELKQWLRDERCYFRPTGYIDGVMQRTEEICW